MRPEKSIKTASPMKSVVTPRKHLETAGEDNKGPLPVSENADSLQKIEDSPETGTIDMEEIGK